MKNIIIILSAFLIISCSKKQTNYPKAKDIELNFLSEYIYPANKEFKGTIIGGLSGIDNDNNGNYYLISDDFENQRFYKTKINIKNNKITDINFKNVVVLNPKKDSIFNDFLDLESIIIQNNKILISSEGYTQGKDYVAKNPYIFQVDTLGNFISKPTLSSRFYAISKKRPLIRKNGVFEGLSKSYDNKGFWVANELPLTTDGAEPSFKKAKYPVRFTYYDTETQKPIKEFIYELSALPRKEKGNFNISGLTDILEYKKNHFFIIERAYQQGYKNEENIVKIYKATIQENSTNSLNLNDLQDKKYTPMKKELVLDFNSIKHKLTDNHIDNIEGICFGEKLQNGNQSLIIISDDNFQLYGEQFNQFLLFEIVNK